jgi:hypothetical protein
VLDEEEVVGVVEVHGVDGGGAGIDDDDEKIEEAVKMVLFLV